MKLVKYVVKINGEVCIKTNISRIKDYPGVTKVIYDYSDNDEKVLIKVFSDDTIKDVEGFLSTICNHAVPDCQSASVKVIENTSLFTKLVKPVVFDVEVDSYGAVSKVVCPQKYSLSYLRKE